MAEGEYEYCASGDKGLSGDPGVRGEAEDGAKPGWYGMLIGDPCAL